MTRHDLTAQEWAKLLPFLRQAAHGSLGNAAACRRCISAVRWICRTGSPWCDLPAAYEPWNTIYRRFVRWSAAGVWAAMAAYCADDPDWEHGIVDSTIVRAHPCAAGGQAVRRVTTPWAAVGAPSSVSDKLYWGQ